MQCLRERCFNFDSQRISGYCCGNCNKVGFCTTSSSVSGIVEILIVQLVIFYDPMNNRSRKLIPNLKVDGTLKSIGKLK